jgi:hypothetical protein
VTTRDQRVWRGRLEPLVSAVLLRADCGLLLALAPLGLLPLLLASALGVGTALLREDLLEGRHDHVDLVLLGDPLELGRKLAVSLRGDG